MANLDKTQGLKWQFTQEFITLKRCQRLWRQTSPRETSFIYNSNCLGNNILHVLDFVLDNLNPACSNLVYILHVLDFPFQLWSPIKRRQVV
ncbi:hypothetical protein Hanom_Chr12g01157811 [Helianthus anomalus]